MSTTVHDTWQSCLEKLSAELPSQSFETWIRPIRPVALEERDSGRELRLGLPSTFHREWLREQYDEIISEAAGSVVGSGTHVSYEVTDMDEGERAMNSGTASYAQVSPATWSDGGVRHATTHRRHYHTTTAVRTTPNGRHTRVDPNLNPGYTFDRFIEGDCNRLARSAALAVAKSPGQTSFNPLFIYGGVGLGKTHLAQAIGNESQTKRTAERILYVTCEQFTTEFVQAIQCNKVTDFTALYCGIDLLIVDDIQFLEGKEKTQEEFFHIFNELHQRGRQIILCADRPPSKIPGIEERLLSRFQWGLSADVQQPDLETRIAILQRKAADQHLDLPGEIVEFVAANIRTNIRNLEGALNRLAAYVAIHGNGLTLDEARHALRDMLERSQKPLEPGEIMRIVAQHYGYRNEDLYGRSRKRDVANARQVAMYLCKQLTPLSLAAIGNMFGGRDHSTVIHACKAVQDRMDVDPAYREEVVDIQSKLQQRLR